MTINEPSHGPFVATRRAVSSADPLATGFCTMPRWLGGSAQAASGSLRLSYFTAPETASKANISVATATVAAAATPTLCRMGVYSVATNGDLTLIASTANDTTLFAATSTVYTKAFSVACPFVAGNRYAWGPLVVTAAAMPSFISGPGSNAAEMALAPRLNGAVSGLSDLPSSVANGSVGGSGLGLIYARLT